MLTGSAAVQHRCRANSESRDAAVCEMATAHNRPYGRGASSTALLAPQTGTAISSNSLHWHDDATRIPNSLDRMALSTNDLLTNSVTCSTLPEPKSLDCPDW
jgi:hypothetical protein